MFLLISIYLSPLSIKYGTAYIIFSGCIFPVPSIGCHTNTQLSQSSVVTFETLHDQTLVTLVVFNINSGAITHEVFIYNPRDITTFQSFIFQKCIHCSLLILSNSL